MGNTQIVSASRNNRDVLEDIVSAVKDVSGLQRSTDMEGGGKIAVGTTPVEATFAGTSEAITITADFDNTALIYVGKSNVATDGSNAIRPLTAGQSIELDYDDTSNALYVVAASASQNFWKGALL